jgi:hypothetical protein
MGLAPPTQIGKMAGQKQRGGRTALAMAACHEVNQELITAMQTLNLHSYCELLQDLG